MHPVLNFADIRPIQIYYPLKIKHNNNIYEVLMINDLNNIRIYKQ